MKGRVETLTPPNRPKPIGPYSHVAKVGQHIAIGGTAGFDLDHVVHVNVFLQGL